ncbi:MAG: hydroxymethylbilane synthase [Nitrososphaeria archaeon]
MIRLGTRPSRLAIIQAEMVSERLSQAINDEIKIVPIATDGDLSSRPDINLKSAFTRRLEEAITNGIIDAAVHSLKDFPLQAMAGLSLVSFPISQDPSDYLVSDSGADLFELEAGKSIGTGSSRRMALIKFYRPDLNVRSLRGNVDTRIRKYREQGLDGVVLSGAGIIRLGSKVNYKRLNPEFFIPAAGQGIIAVEAKEGTRVAVLLKAINDWWAELRAKTERAFIERLGGDCNVPAGIFIKNYGTTIFLKGFLASGNTTKFSVLTGSIKEAERAGNELAERLFN